MRTLGIRGFSTLLGIGPLNPTFIITTIFVSNFIGIVFARTLHYQFYSWYFHTLPFLLWHVEMLPPIAKLFAFVCIEICFNIFPATSTSSLLLQVLSYVIIIEINILIISITLYAVRAFLFLFFVSQSCHFVLLVALYFSPVPSIFRKRNRND